MTIMYIPEYKAINFRIHMNNKHLYTKNSAKRIWVAILRIYLCFGGIEGLLASMNEGSCIYDIKVSTSSADHLSTLVWTFDSTTYRRQCSGHNSRSLFPTSWLSFTAPLIFQAPRKAP